MKGTPMTSSDIHALASPSDAGAALNAPVAVFPVVLNFPYKGQQRSESLSFPAPIDLPARGEIITFKFRDFGTLRRISATVDHVIREFYGPATVTGIDAGLIVQIHLDGVTDQPV